MPQPQRSAAQKIDDYEDAARDDFDLPFSEADWDAWEAGPGWNSYPGMPGASS